MNPLSSLACNLGRRFRASNEARMQRALLVGDTAAVERAQALDSLRRHTERVVTESNQRHAEQKAAQRVNDDMMGQYLAEFRAA